MPHFTLLIDAAGPVVNASVMVSAGRRQALLAEGLEVPPTRVIRALIDTGASLTSIEPGVLSALGLTPTGTIELVTPSTGTGIHTASTYDVDVTIAGTSVENPLIISNLRVATSELFLRQGIHALIGRDILQHCILVYNGSMNQFSLSF